MGRSVLGGVSICGEMSLVQREEVNMQKTIT